MKERIEQLLHDAEQKIRDARSETGLQEVRANILGKQGSLTGLLKELPRLDASLRPEMGRVVNEAKNKLSALIDARREELKLKASAVPPDFDCTVPGLPPLSGGLHPITQMRYDLDDAFRSMGFEIFQEDDITSELYAFDKLNFPPNHPARESMDTYWLEGHDRGAAGEKLCLRPPSRPGAASGICRRTSRPTASCTPAESTATKRPTPGTSVPSSSMRRWSWITISPLLPARS